MGTRSSRTHSLTGPWQSQHDEQLGRPGPTARRPSPLCLTAVRGEDREGPALEWSDGAETTLIESHEASGPVSAGEHNERAVGESKFEVCVARV